MDSVSSPWKTKTTQYPLETQSTVSQLTIETFELTTVSLNERTVQPLVGTEDGRIRGVNEKMMIDEMIEEGAVTEGDGQGVGVQRGEKGK